VAARGTCPARGERDIRYRFDKFILPHWKDRPFGGLRRSEVIALLDQVEDDHGSRLADLVLSDIRKMMNWYAARNDDYTSPIVRGMRRGKSVSRERTLDEDEIRAVWKAADQMGTYGAILKTLLLTTQRRAKVATMKWDDLDGDEWTIATQEREKGNAGTLRLPQMALDIINAQPRLAYNPFVFGAATGKGHLNSWTQRKGEIDAKLPKGDARLDASRPASHRAITDGRLRRAS
jgi:integrase